MSRLFEEYVHAGIVVRRVPDRSRSRSLHQDAQRTREVLASFEQAVGITDRNANTLIKLAYDGIMSLVRSRMCADGLFSSGHGAHEAEVAFMRTLGVPEREVLICDRLRTLRNGIMYYGKDLDAKYASQVLSLFEKLFERLGSEDGL